MDERVEARPLDDPAVAEVLGVSTLTLATSDASGAVHAAPVFFAAADDLRLLFLSDPASQHVRDGAGGRPVAAAIHVETAAWQEIRGLQLRGMVERVPDGPERDRAAAPYVAKFPFVAGLAEVVERAGLFVFVPDWIRLIDNRRAFGFRREWRRALEGWTELG